MVAGPIRRLFVAGSTLKNGVVFPKVPSTCILGVSNPVAPRVNVSVPAMDTPITSPDGLNRPVVVELSNASEGNAAVPSANLAVV